MKATIASFRQGRHHQTDNQMVLHVEGVSDKEKAAGLVGREVTWKTPSGKEIKGKVTGSHGNSGAVKVLFEKGMPGQAVTAKVELQ